MIQQEFYRIREDGVNLIRTYSDENKYIKQVETGNEYTDAIDVEPLRFTYVETDKVIEVAEEIERTPTN